MPTSPTMSEFGINELPKRTREPSENPDKFYVDWPKQGGLIRDPSNEKMWVAFGYEIVDKILNDKRFGKQAPKGAANRLPNNVRRRNERQKIKHLSFLDPPQHTRVRRLLIQAFDTNRVEQRRDAIQSIVDRMLDRLIPRGSMDIMRDFAHPIPCRMMCDMLGIPQVKRARIVELSSILIDAHSAALSTNNSDEEQHKIVEATEFEFDQHLTTLIDSRRRQPQDDLITVLVTAQTDAGKLSPDELLVNLRALFIAVHENLVNLIGNSLLALHQHPKQLELLKTKPSLMPRAINEFLRYDSPIQHVFRIAQTDLPLAGKIIKAGEAIFCCLGSANHDEKVFSTPSKLDIQRNEAKSKSFGSGIHFCLGAQLAKLATEIALNSLLKRIPSLVLTDIDTLQRRPSNTIHGLTALHAKW